MLYDFQTGILRGLYLANQQACQLNCHMGNALLVELYRIGAGAVVVSPTLSEIEAPEVGPLCLVYLQNLVCGQNVRGCKRMHRHVHTCRNRAI